MTEVLVLFGSNVDPETSSVSAARALAWVLDGLRLSSAWKSSAVGTRDAPAFVNWVARGRTDLGPAELKFDGLRPIEERLGRVRTADVNAPRIVDLDILLYGDLVLSDANAGLELPDPDLCRQPYALVPAAEVAPQIVVPRCDRAGAVSLARLAEKAETEGLLCLGMVTALTA